MPLRQFGSSFKILPAHAPLTLVLHPSDLFSDDQIEQHHLQHQSWTLDFSAFPTYAANGIREQIRGRKQKRKQESLDDGDASQDRGASQVWGYNKRKKTGSKSNKLSPPRRR